MPRAGPRGTIPLLCAMGPNIMLEGASCSLCHEGLVRRWSKEGLVRRFAVAAWAAFLLGACSLVEHFDAPKIAKLDEPTVRAFASNQQAAWVAHDFDRF